MQNLTSKIYFKLITKNIIITLILLLNFFCLSNGPDFIIIGAQKAGTTSLYHYLVQHPNIRKASVKEIHFFDIQFENGIQWYEKQFPQKKYNDDFLVGEATPYYLFHPLAAKRIYKHYPKAKLIVILKEPVARAFSQYKMAVRLGIEKRTFEEAIRNEINKIKIEEKKIILNPSYNSKIHKHLSYLSRGIYLEQIKRYLKYFPLKQILFIKSEDLLNNTANVVNEVFLFLELKPYHLANYGYLHIASNKLQLNTDTKDRLQTFFKPFNLSLQKYLNSLKLNIQLNW